jgi:hypothetical protein
MLLPVMVHAVTVGPLHGKPGPSLRAIASPSAGMAVEELPDTGFPKELERLGDLSGAAVEWQRLAYKSGGREREQALTNATRLYIAMNNPVTASVIINELLSENPASPYAPEALYHISTGTRTAINVTAQTTALKQLQTAFPENAWTKAALMNDVWAQAEKGRIKQTYKLPEAEEMKKRIKKVRGLQQEKVARAGALGVIVPGAGHAYAGNVPQGLTVLLVWFLFTLAFLSSCRHRHYAYSFLFVIPSAALWLTSPVVAMQLVRDETEKKVVADLAKWNDLKPQIPSNPTPQSTQ